jgi:hypothetical protein
MQEALIRSIQLETSVGRKWNNQKKQTNLATRDYYVISLTKKKKKTKRFAKTRFPDQCSFITMKGRYLEGHLSAYFQIHWVDSKRHESKHIIECICSFQNKFLVPKQRERHITFSVHANQKKGGFKKRGPCSDKAQTLSKMRSLIFTTIL